MEEVRFRVWNGQAMVYDVMAGKFGVFYVNPYNNGIDENDSASLSPFNTKYPDNIILMQSTGVTDKEGNGIFKDDILSDGKNTFRVYWVQGGFAIKAPAWCEDKSDLKPTDELTLCPLADAQTRSYIMQSCEVVGNIYELKDKQ
jgi:uncharacterized phage protein (TIGR01671 family)